MKNKSIILDVFRLLAIDINSKANQKNISRDKIFASEGKYMQIVEMSKRMSLSKQFLSLNLITGIFNKQNFKIKNRVISVLE